MRLLDPPPFPLNADVRTTFGKNTTPTDASRKGVRNLEFTSPRTGGIVVIGDSMLAKTNAVSGYNNDIVTQLIAKPNWKGRVSVSNLAQNSATAQGWANVFSSQTNYLGRDFGLAIVMLWTNDISVNRSAAQIQADLTTILTILRNTGSKILLIIPPSVGTLSAPQLATRAAMIAWAQASVPTFADHFYDASWLTSADTFDGIHLTAANNGVVATAIDAMFATPFFPDIYFPGPVAQGTTNIRRSGLNEVGIDFTLEPTAYDNDTDANHPRPTDIRGSRGEPYFPFPFPTGCGINVGAAAATQALIPNNLNLGTGNFMIAAWVTLGARHVGSSQNQAVILANDGASPDMFYIASSTSGGSANICKPVLRIDGTDLSFPNLPFLTVGKPAFVAVRRVSGLIYAFVDGGAWGTPQGNTNAITFDRAFWRNAGVAAAQWFQGQIHSLVVKTNGTHSTREIEYIMRGGSPFVGDGTVDAYWDFREGTGLPIDLSTNHRLLDLSTATNWSWLSPTGMPSRSESADNGDAAATLTVNLSSGTQRWATVLTADRAVTLSTTNARNGARFRIVREATATGAFNLNVGTGPLKALGTAGTWCEVEFDGTVWRLSAAGTL